MRVNDRDSMYLLMMYVYLKSYEDAINDFEAAMENTGCPDEALMMVKQKFKEKVDRAARDLNSANCGR